MASDPPPARQPAPLRLRCVSVGPRNDGRDYGLLQRFGNPPLPATASASLRDFSLALFEWALDPRPPFSLMFDLGAGLHFLGKAAFVRRGGYGPIARANGLLLGAKALAALEWRPHRLLGLVQPAEAGEWTGTEIEVALPLAAAPQAGDAGLRQVGRALHLVRGRCVVEVETMPAEAAISSLLEAASPDLVRIHAWATTRDLDRIGRFDPAALQLQVVSVPAGAPVRADAHRLSASGLKGLAVPSSEVDELWHALFAPGVVSSAWRSRYPVAAEAVDWKSHSFPRDRLDEDPQRVLIDEMLATIRRVKAEAEPMWGLIELWADAAESLPGARRTAAASAIAALIRRMIAMQSTDTQKAELLEGYLGRIQPRLKAAPPLLGAAIAAEHELIASLGEAELEVLVSAGLGTTFAEDLAAETRRGQLTDAQLRAIARSMREVIRKEADPASIAAAMSIAERTPATPSESARRLIEELLELGEDLLLAERPGFAWRDAIAPLVNIWRAAEASGLRTAVVKRLLAAPRTFWRNVHDRDARRRCFVVVTRLSAATGRA